MSLNPATKPVYLRAASMVTSVGLNSAQTASAVRAGIGGYAESAIYNKQSDPMTLAMLPTDVIPALNEAVSSVGSGLTSRQTRMICLAGLAFEELAAKYSELDGLPSLQAGPETLPDMPEACHPDLLDHIVEQIGTGINRDYSALLAHGRAGGIEALYHAMRVVEGGRSKSAIVGGVDSFLDLKLLSALDAENRILSEGIMDGFAPGEGAGFIVISSDPGPFEDSGKQILIYPPGLADEPGHRYSKEPYLGDGLAQSFSGALDRTGLAQIETVFASLNGENFGAKEFGVAVTRNSDRIQASHVVEHVAEFLGDLGAAYFPVSVGLAAVGLVKGYVKGPIINFAASDGKHRGAACMALA